jgi:hypothetical protein
MTGSHPGRRQLEEAAMNIDQIRSNLKRLENDRTVIQARLLFGAYGGDICAFIKLIVEPPFSAEREQELTLMAREAANSPTMRVIIEYRARESANGRE